MEQGGPETGHHASPYVTDRGAQNQRLLLNRDAELNKRPRTMFRGQFRKNNPQAKALITVPKATWH